MQNIFRHGNWGAALQPMELKALHCVSVPQAAVGWWSIHWFRPRLEGPIWKPQCDDRLSSNFHHIGSAVCHFDTAAARGIPHCGYSRSLVQ